MTRMQWNDSMATGIPSIDRQHQELFRILNSMHNKMVEGRKDAAYSDAIDSLRDYVKYHLAYEEKLMRRCGYPNLGEHLEIHNKFVERFSTMDRECTEDAECEIKEIQAFLIDWLANHILKEDKKYVSCVLSAGAQ